MFESALYGMGNIPQQSAGPQPNPLAGFIPIIIIFVIIYFLMLRPQQKKLKEHQTMLDNIKKGDKIITSGGIHGTVANLEGNTIKLSVSENVTITISKEAIAKVIVN